MLVGVAGKVGGCSVTGGAIIPLGAGLIGSGVADKVSAACTGAICATIGLGAEAEMVLVVPGIGVDIVAPGCGTGGLPGEPAGVGEGEIVGCGCGVEGVGVGEGL